MARAAFPAGPGTDSLLRGFEGAKRRLADGRVSFVPSVYNLGMAALAFPGVEIEVEGAAPPSPFSRPANTSPEAFDWCNYTPKLPPRAHQLQALQRCADAPAFGIWHEPGLGKSKLALDKAGRHYCRKEIDALLVVTLNTVHVQWATEQVPLHLGVPHYTQAYQKKPLPDALYRAGDGLRVLCVSFDALISKGGRAEVDRFVKAHAGRYMMVVDESHAIKNHKSQRAIACCEVGRKARFRLAMTGTPLAKALEDEWSQFRFLDESILGVRYLTTFRAQYCVMGGYENRSVIAHKNVDQFISKTAPYCDRLRKCDVLDIPKLYSVFHFDLSAEQRKHYDALRRNLLTELQDGTTITAQNAAVLLTRLQQISSGLLVGEDGAAVRLENARLKALMTLLESHESASKVLIWARFTHEIEDVAAALNGDVPGQAVRLYGANTPEERNAAVDRFMNDPACRFLVANPAAGGTGINLQGECRTVIYYSNSYNAVHRWQSEDRVHRIGTTGAISYVDLVARKTGDARILANLQSKKDLATLTHKSDLDLLTEIVSERDD